MKKLITLFLLLFIPNTRAKDFVIYSIVQPPPTKSDEKNIPKDYYINMGKLNGIDVGGELAVIRTITQFNPYEDKTKIYYHIPIGTIQIIHAEDYAAIGRQVELKDRNKIPNLEIPNFMIGDKVKVALK